MARRTTTKNPFRYDTTFSPTRLSNSTLLRALRRFSRLRRARFTITDFDRWRARPCHSRTLAARFGSWRAALAAADLTSHAARRRYSTDELLNNLDRVWRTLGRRPGIRSLSRLSPITAYPYTARWGSLARACQLLAAHRRGRLSRAAIDRAATPARRAAVSLSARWRIMTRDRFRCTACGASPATNPKVALHVDHITPVSAHGNSHDSNLRTLCAPCNLGRRWHPPPPGEVPAPRRRRGLLSSTPPTKPRRL